MKYFDILSVWVRIFLLLFLFFDTNIANATTVSKARFWEHLKETHIENLSPFDNRGNSLEDNCVRIGKHYWYINDLDDIDSDERLGNLIFAFSYQINNIYNRYDGEKAFLIIYDIEPLKQKLGINKDSIYNSLYMSFTNDSLSFWDTTNQFLPFIALKTRPRATYSPNDSLPTFEENIMIMANDRIYNFYLANDKIRTKGMEAFNMFDKRCINIAKSLDLRSYRVKEIEKEIKEKKERQEAIWIKIIYSIISLLGIGVYALSLRNMGKKNNLAKKWLTFIGICTGIAIIVMGIGVFMYPNDSDTQGALFVIYIPTVIINSIFSLYFAKKTNEENYDYNLIPEWLSRGLKINNEFKKRLLLILLIYPFFFIVPIPIIGLFWGIFYIIPLLLILGIIWIVLWIKEGKRMDDKHQVQNDRAQLYCRHCGKLIDADSDFCRYCGKEL